MGRKSKRAYLEAIRARYAKADRESKGRILDEFCAVCGYHRKHAIRLLNRADNRPRARRGRRSPYKEQPAFMPALEEIWNATDFMCSSRLKACISTWLPYYEQLHGALPRSVRSSLLCVSRATLDRLLAPIRRRCGKGRCGTKPGSMLRNQIPIRTHNWDITKPGHMEADTVAHCGNSLAGDFAWSVVMTDILTTWTELRSVWNKGSGDVVDQVHDIEVHLPFDLLGFDCDNGSEFLNHHLVRYFADRDAPVAFTRSRPYRKNDNAHVEQKNWAHARQLLGYDRIDNPHVVPLINDLYANEWSLYQNHFCPSVKLLSKTRIGSRYRKTYDAPQTPYQRVMACPDISKDRKKRLKQVHDQFNPFILKKAIQRKLRAIFKKLSVTSNVRQRI